MSPAAKENVVKVNIFGNEYRVQGDADEAHIQTVAAYVDQMMRDIADHGKHISPTRIAILAAFNIAHEVFTLREGGSVPDEDAEEKARDLLRLFEEGTDA